MSTRDTVGVGNPLVTVEVDATPLAKANWAHLGKHSEGPMSRVGRWPKDTENRRAYDRRRCIVRHEWFKEWRPRGLRNRWRNPISGQLVRCIRYAVLEEGESRASIARSYGISYSYVCAIVKYKVRG